jgi:hypothetical protein
MNVMFVWMTLTMVRKCKKLPHPGFTCEKANNNDFLFERYKLELGLKNALIAKKT